MSRINLNIVATGDFSSVNRQLDSLRATVAQINARGAGIGISQRDLDSVSRAARSYDSLLHSTGAFSRQMVNVQDQTARFGRELEAGKLKLGQYFQIWSRGSSEARRNMRELAAQQMALENAIVRTDTSKIGKAYVDVPRLMQEAGRGTALARKEQQLYNLALYQGGNAMINWGKNTQWAGRQLTVGLTVPLMMFGQKAANAFKEFDQQMTRMIKVYGDGINSATNAQLEAIRGQVTSLAQDLAGRWGVAMKDTAAMASDLAATGLTGVKLLKGTEEAMRLATLGELDRQEAMKATVALQTTFGLSSKELAKSIDFLNATENATSTSLQDLVEGIPRAGTVIKQLGGDYRELTVMMVAMREAGVSAGESANAIKSTLGALINPTEKIRDKFDRFGISLSNIRDKAGGDPVKMFQSLGIELNKLDKITKARLIETLFGKYQFARVSSLIDNLGKKGSQTQKVFELMGTSAGMMAKSAQQELDRLANSPSGKYARSLESFQAKLLPIGEKFLNVASKIMDAFGRVFDFIDKHPGLQNFLTNIAGLVALVGPVIMLTGVFGNFLGYLVKGFATVKNFGNGFKGFGKLVTAESVAAARAGDLFQASLVGQSEAAAILTEALTRLNAELMTYRGQAGGAAGGPGPIPPIIPPGGGGGSRPPTRPSGPVILGGGVEPTGTPPQLIIPGKTSGGGELIIPGKPDKVVISGPVSVAMGGSAPIAATMSGSAIDEWQPRSDAKGGRRGTAILHSTSRQELIAEVQHEITKDIMTPGSGSQLGQIVNAAGKGTGPLGLNFRAKQEAARAARLKSKGGSTLLTDDDYAVARKNLLDELVTRGAWSAKGAPPSGAAAAINSAIGSVPQHFSMPSAAALSAVGVSLTPEMEKEIMLQQLRAWGAKAGPGALGKVEDIISGKGSTQLSGPELQSWLGAQSRMPQAGRAFVDSTMAQAEKLLTTHSGLIDENLTKLYKEATAAAGSGDWEATKTAVTSLQEHMKQNFSYMGESLEKRIAEVNRQYDMAFKDAFRLTDANLDMTERVRIAAENAQAKVDKFLDQEGMRIAQKFAENEKALDAASSQLGISTRYSRQGMGEVVTAAASRSVAAADRVSRAEENIGNAVAESINESNAAMEQAAAAEEQAAARVRSATTGSAPGLIIPGRTGSAPKKIIIPGRRAMGGPIYYGPGGGVSGPGGPKDDLIPAYLSNGEFVIKADSVDKIGVNNLRHMNETGTLPGMAMGGLMSKVPHLAGGWTGQLSVLWKAIANKEERSAISTLLGINNTKAGWRAFKPEKSHAFQLKGSTGENVFGQTGVSVLVPREMNQLLRQMYHMADDTTYEKYFKNNPEMYRILKDRGQPATYKEAKAFVKFLKDYEGEQILKQSKGMFTLNSSRRYEKATTEFMDRMFAGSGTMRENFIQNQLLLMKSSELARGRNLTTVQSELKEMEKILRSRNSEEQYKEFIAKQRDKYPNAEFYAMGGPVYGSGGPVSDSIPARLSNGEYVVSAKGHKAAGTRFLDAINNGQFTMGYARGGRVHYKNGVRAFPEGDAVENSGFKTTEKRGMNETRKQIIDRDGFNAPPPTQMTAAGQAAGRSMASAALSGLGKGSKAVGQIMGRAALTGLENWAENRKRKANMTPEERAKAKEEKGSAGGMKSMAAGMALSTIGGFMSSSDNPTIQGAGNIAMYAGMGAMAGPWGAAAGAIAGAAKMMFDNSQKAIDDSMKQVSEYAQGFRGLSAADQQIFGSDLQSLAQINIDKINEKTDAAKNALEQFTESVKNAAEGTDEYVTKQIFQSAQTTQDLLNDPRFQSKLAETKMAVEQSGGSVEERQQKILSWVEAYSKAVGRTDTAQLLGVVGKSLREKGGMAAGADAIKQMQSGANRISESFKDIPQEQQQLFKEKLLPAMQDFSKQAALTDKQIKIDDKVIGSFAEAAMDPNFINAVADYQRTGGAADFGHKITIGGKEANAESIKAIADPLLKIQNAFTGKEDTQLQQNAKTQTTSFWGGVAGNILAPAPLTLLLSGGRLGTGVVKGPNTNAFNQGFGAMGIDITDPTQIEKMNQLTIITEQLNKSSSMLSESFASFHDNDLLKFLDEFNFAAKTLGTEGIQSARTGFQGLYEELKKDEEINKGALVSWNAVIAAVNNGDMSTASLDDLALAARAAKLDLVNLGFQYSELARMSRDQINFVINRTIVEKGIQSTQQTRSAGWRQDLQSAYNAYLENKDNKPSKSSNGGSSGGGSGGGGGGSSPQFDSTPYDKAIKGQQAIIELINKEREARQKLADAQKANDDYMKSEWALRKKIAEAQGAGDFLGADLAQRELNQLQEQKAKDDAERLKRDEEDKRLQAAQKEIERLQEALTAAQKAFDKANQGSGGSSSGGGGGGGAKTTDQTTIQNLPEGVTPATIEAGFKNAIMQKGFPSLEAALKDPQVKKQFGYAVQLLGEDGAMQMFGGLFKDTKENMLNAFPKVKEAFASLNEKLANDPTISGMNPEQQGAIFTAISDIIVKNKGNIGKSIEEIKGMLKNIVSPEDFKNISSTIETTLGGQLKNGLILASTAANSPEWKQALKNEIFTGLGGSIKPSDLPKSVQDKFDAVINEIAKNGSASPESMDALEKAMLPYSNYGFGGNHPSGSISADAAQRTVDSGAQGKFTGMLETLITTGTAAAEKKSMDNPIDMTAVTSVIRVPNGTVTFEDGKDPQWTGNGEYTSVNTAVKKADGGYISGPGGPRDDLIPAMLSDGEYVVQASAVDYYGTGLLDSINTRKFADGGKVKKMQDMMNIVKNRAAGISGFMEMDRKLKFADGGHVRGTPRGIPNQDFISKVEPLAEQYQNTRYSSQVPGVPGNAPGVRGHGGGGWGCATSVYWLFTHGLGSSFGLDPSMSDNNLHSAIRNGPINGPYLPGDIVLMKNDKGVNLWADANHTEMVMSGNRVWNGGVGIRSGLSFRYPIVGVKRPLNAGYIFPEVDSKDSFMTNANSKYTIGKFHNGGAVQYSKGGEVMAMVQGGEVVVPINTVDKVNPLLDALTSGKMGLGEITNNITINGANHSPKVIAEMVVGEIEKSMKRTVNITRVR